MVGGQRQLVELPAIVGVDLERFPPGDIEGFLFDKSVAYRLIFSSLGQNWFVVDIAATELCYLRFATRSRREVLQVEVFHVQH